MDPPSQSFIDLSTMEALEYTETVHCHLTLLLFTFLTHNNRIRDLAAIVHHRQLLPLFAIPLCIHLTKNSSKRQLPLSAFIAFLVLQTICRLPLRCCTDMRSIVVLLLVPDSVSTKHSVGMGYDVKDTPKKIEY